MTLPLWCELHQLPHATSSRISHTFKQRIPVHHDYLIYPHHVPFTQMLSDHYIFPRKFFFRHIINTATVRVFTDIFITTTMETAEYWLMAQEYSIWNAAIASLQFWAEDLDPVTLGIASECIYTIFFWTPMSHMLCQLPEDVLFGCFVIALNATLTQKLSSADEGYESGSDTVDLPTPLRKTPHIHHVSSMKHASFNPAHTTPHSTTHSSPQTPTRPVHHHLSFNSDSGQDSDSTSIHSGSSDSTAVYSDSPDEEEDFPTVPLDDEHWTSEIVPERTFCIHENGLPNNVCQHICPYGSNDTVSYMDSLDLSDILDYEDYMMTTSDDDKIPAMEEVPY